MIAHQRCAAFWSPSAIWICMRSGAPVVFLLMVTVMPAFVGATRLDIRAFTLGLVDVPAHHGDVVVPRLDGAAGAEQEVGDRGEAQLLHEELHLASGGAPHVAVPVAVVDVAAVLDAARAAGPPLPPAPSSSSRAARAGRAGDTRRGTGEHRSRTVLRSRRRLPQTPQFETLERMSIQPAPRVDPDPPPHRRSPGSTRGRCRETLPHVPQLATSVIRSMQLWLH